MGCHRGAGGRCGYWPDPDARGSGLLVGQPPPLRGGMRGARKLHPYRWLAGLRGSGGKRLPAGDHEAKNLQRARLQTDASGPSRRLAAEAMVARHTPGRRGALLPPLLLDEFTFRFNRRKSARRGKLFFRLVRSRLSPPRPGLTNRWFGPANRNHNLLGSAESSVYPAGAICCWEGRGW